MIPAQIIPLSEIPLTENGKLNCQALPEPRTIAVARTAPRTDTERKLAGIWTDVLGIEGVGVEDNFFDLGGHSLLAIQAHLRIGDAFAIDLPLRTLFEARGLEALAREIDALQDGAAADDGALREIAALMDELEA